MELVIALRMLARRPLLLALGLVLAVGIGATASGYLPAGPLASAQTRSAVATASILIDTPRPLAADLRANAATIAEQATMLAERLPADDTRTFIARRAGVRPSDLAVLSSRTAIVGRSSPVARSAVAAASTPQSRYRVIVSATNDIPIISVVAAAADRTTAARLAGATAPAIASVVDAAPDTVVKRVRVEALAPPRTVVVVSGGPNPLVGVIGGLFTFVGWCWSVIIAVGLARMRRARRAGPDARFTRLRALG